MIQEKTQAQTDLKIMTQSSVATLKNEDESLNDTDMNLKIIPRQVLLSNIEVTKKPELQLHKNSSAPILHVRQLRNKKVSHLATSNKLIPEKKLPLLADNRLYYHYSSSKNKRKSQQSQCERDGSLNQFDDIQNKVKQRMMGKRNSMGVQRDEKDDLRFSRFSNQRGSEQKSQALVLAENDQALFVNQDEESKLFQKFLKTFSTTNWSEFANKVLDNDRNVERDFMTSTQPKNKQKISRNSLLVAPSTHNNINHYIKTFGSFKQHQWQKLNFDLNLNRAPQTIKQMVHASSAQEGIRALKYQAKDEIAKSGAFLTEMNNDDIYCKDQSALQQIDNKKKYQIEGNQELSPVVDSNKVQHDTRFLQFKKQNEILQLKSSLKQLNMLQQIGSVSILKEYKYPGSVDEIVKFIKDKDLDLYEKILQTRNMIKKRTDSNNPAEPNFINNSSQKYHIKDKEFSRLFTMKERKQVVVLKEWLDYMIEHYVKLDGAMSTKRLQNEQLILAFTLSDLKGQMSVECQERGEIIEKILALVFDMFKCYELSFDVIIQEEVAQHKELLKVQTIKKDETLRKKDKEIERQSQKIQELEKVIQDKNYTINALIAKDKGIDIRFKVMKNLIDNLIFSYKQKINREFEKSKLERHLARNFVHELSELKKFGNKYESLDTDNLPPSDEDRIRENMKRKVNKLTQTENRSLMISNLLGINGAPRRESTLASEYRNQGTGNDYSAKNQNTVVNDKDDALLIDADSLQEQSIDNSKIDYQSATDQTGNDTLNNQVQNSIEINNQDAMKIEQNDEEDIKIVIDHNSDENTVELDNVSNYLSQNSNLYTDDEEEKAQQEVINQQETLKMQEQQEAMLEILDQYSPEMLLEIINFYNVKTDTYNEDKEIQTDAGILSPIRRATLQQTSKNIIMTNRVINGFASGFSPSNSVGTLQISRNSSANESLDNKQFQIKPVGSPSAFGKRGSSNGMKGPLSGKQSSETSAFDEETSPLRKDQYLSLEDILTELSNLNISDLDALMSTDKQYHKKSMNFLSSLIQQLKKTKQFKHLVDKQAKERLREEDHKEKAKHDKWNSRKSSVKISQKSKTLKNLTKNITQNAIVEESQSSSGGESSERMKFKLQSSATKLLESKKTKSSKKASLSSKPKMIEKSTQYEVSNEEYERIKRNYLKDLPSGNNRQTPQLNTQRSSSTFEEPNQNNIVIESLDNQTSSYESKSKQKLKHMVHLVGRMSIAFQNKTSLLAGGADKSNISRSSFISANSNQHTQFAPFNLGDRSINKTRASTHPMGKFLPVFIEKYKENNKAFLNVNQMTVKLVLKMIIQFYSDKVSQAKDSIYIKASTLGEFLYDQLFNKYGIANITEKKIKELLLSVMKYKGTNLTVSLFAKFMQLEDDYYSNDDLSFLFRLNKQFVQNDAFQIGVRKEYNFESPNIIFQTAYDVLTNYLSKKLQPKTLLKVQDDMKQFLKDHVVQQQQGGIILIASERFIEAMINGYKFIKYLIFEQLRSQFDIVAVDEIYPQCLQDRLFDCDSFLKLLATYNTRGQLEKENPYQLFEKNKVIMSGNQTSAAAVKDEEKRISLESLISVIFKFELIIV